MISRADPKDSAARGFTLIELLVVLTILGMMLTLFLERGSPHSRALDLRAAAGELTDVLRLAHSEAIRTNRAVSVGFDLAHRRYQTDGAQPHALPTDLGLDLVTAKGERPAMMASPEITTPFIRFEPDGSSSGGTIRLSAGTRHIEIGIDWINGRISQTSPR